jgi:hypothetical protein
MAPAFPSTRRAAAFGVLLVFLLTLPVTLHWAGGVSREEAFRGISERAGTFDYFRRQMFEEHSPVDILFCGGSLLGNAIDIPALERDLSRALGRQATVVLLRQSWQGPDMNYFVARDFMEHRKAKILVIAAPAFVHHSNQPHVQLLRVIRYGDHPGALDGLSLRSQMALYADYVLGAPRQALNLLRPNRVYPEGVVPDSPHLHPSGYMGRPFVRRQVVIPPIPPASMILSGENSGSFRFDGAPLNAYQLHFLKKTEELAQQQGALLVILHLPSPSERGSQVLSERRSVAELLGKGVAYAGVPSARMFENIPDTQFEDYFQDEHLGLNGSQLYTGLIAPVLIQLYEQYTQSH